MEQVRIGFAKEMERRKTPAAGTGARFDSAFRFLEETFGQSQEL